MWYFETSIFSFRPFFPSGFSSNYSTLTPDTPRIPLVNLETPRHENLSSQALSVDDHRKGFVSPVYET